MTDPADRSEWPDILLDALRRARTWRTEMGSADAAVPSLKRVLKELPAHMSADDLLAACGTDLATGDGELACLDLATLAAPLLEGCPELEPAASYPVRWVWTRDCPTSKGQIVHGKCKAMGPRERLTWPESPAPFWTISISLGYWLACLPMERLRLLHHELWHADVKATPVLDEEGEEVGETYTPTTRGHDIEENLATMARFGIRDEGHAKVVAAAVAHPTTAERLRTWHIDPATGQGKLWPGPFTQAMAADELGAAN